MLIDRPERLAAAAAAPKGDAPAGERSRRRARPAPEPRDRRRGAVRRRLARPLRDRRLDLPDHAGRRVRAEERPRRRDRPRHRARARACRCCRAAPARASAARRPARRWSSTPASTCASVARRRCRAPHRDGRAGPRARPPQRAAEAARPLVSGRRLDQRAGDDRRHGRQQLVRLALDRLRQHGAQRARHRRAGSPTAPRSSFGPVADASGRAAAIADFVRDLALQQPRRDRGALAEGAAPRRRLQPRHLPAAERAALHRRRQRQPRAPAGRRRRHARLVAQR